MTEPNKTVSLSTNGHARVLEGKVIIVTGAGGGIGRESCRVLAAAGARLIVSDRSEAEGLATQALLKSEGFASDFVSADVSSETSVQSLVARTVELHGRLDGAFNNAGVEAANKPLADLTLAEWEHGIRVDLTGVLLCLKYQIPAMLASGGGSIVNTASGLARIAVPGQAEYIAAKTGVVGLTRAAAMDYGARGIRVNAILPGVIRTPMISRLSEMPETAAMFSQLRQRHILQRFGEPSEIGEAAKWLLSDAASFVQGTEIVVDGGVLAN